VTKKGIYLTIKNYCVKEGLDPLTIIPRTFYLAPSSSSKSLKDDDLESFESYNEQLRVEGKDPEDSVWILKPASKTNRGFGIKVMKGLQSVMKTVQRTSSAKSVASDDPPEDEPEQNLDKSNPLTKAARRIAQQDGYIVQQYMEHPLLVDGRKFDIRCFVLVTVFEQKGVKDFRSYFFRDAYVRTSSKKYSLDKLTDRATHLTNDAVQKNVQNYGQFEQGNKLSLSEWQSIIDREQPDAPRDVVQNHIFPEIRRLCRLSIAASADQLCDTQIQKSFELFGYDFMVRQDFAPVLIEVNTNPCLEFVCPLLTDIISGVVEDTFKLAVDTNFPPPSKSSRTRASEEAWQILLSEKNRFEPLFP
jgi:tubulin polyglutamylase TTLL1